MNKNEVADLLVDLSIDFCNHTKELNDSIFGNFSITFVPDIYDYVLNDDFEYAEINKSVMENISGLCYINSNNKMLLLVKNKDLKSILPTYFHELVHAFDYLSLSECMKENNLRKLQEIDAFRYWSEFHAEYLSYKYLIDKQGLDSTPQNVVNGFFETVKSRFGNQKEIVLSEYLDLIIRIYGRYMAVWESYKTEIPFLPLELFWNKYYNDLYGFVYRNRTFEKAKYNLDLLDEILAKVENSHARSEN